MKEGDKVKYIGDETCCFTPGKTYTIHRSNYSNYIYVEGNCGTTERLWSSDFKSLKKLKLKLP